MPRNTEAIQKYNGVILLPWQLWCQYNMDHIKFSSLYNTAVATFFRYLCQCRRSKHLKWESILPKKSSRATLMNYKQGRKRYTPVYRYGYKIYITTHLLHFLAQEKQIFKAAMSLQPNGCS